MRVSVVAVLKTLLFYVNVVVNQIAKRTDFPSLLGGDRKRNKQLELLESGIREGE